MREKLLRDQLLISIEKSYNALSKESKRRALEFIFHNELDVFIDAIKLIDVNLVKRPHKRRTRQVVDDTEQVIEMEGGGFF